MGVTQAQAIPKLTAAVIIPGGWIRRQAAHVKPAQRAPGPAQRLGHRPPHRDDQRALGHADAIPLEMIFSLLGQQIAPHHVVRDPQGRQRPTLSTIDHLSHRPSRLKRSKRDVNRLTIRRLVAGLVERFDGRL